MTTSDSAAGEATTAPVASAVPEHVRAAALRAFAARDPAADVLPLLHDEPGGAGRSRTAEFGQGGLRVTLVLEGSELHGTVSPPQVQEVELQRPAGPALAVPVAPDGTWSLAPAPLGPVALVLVVDGCRLRTTWVHLQPS